MTIVGEQLTYMIIIDFINIYSKECSLLGNTQVTIINKSPSLSLSLLIVITP